MSQVYQVGWHTENILVQNTRRPFVRRVQNLLQVGGMPAVAGLPSERHIKAGTDTRGFYTYPLLFYTAFSDVSLAQLRALSLSGAYLFDHVLCLDNLLDRPTICDAGELFLAGMLQQEALSLLYPFFPPNTAFWGYSGAYYDHFVQAILRERTCHHCLIRPYAKDELEFIYAGKPAVAKACIAALALLGGREDLIAPLTASHDAFYVAYQLLDDLQDWRLDYQHRHYSYPLTRAFCQAGWKRRVESDQPPEPDQVKDLLQNSAMADHCISLALAYLDKAESVLKTEPAFKEMAKGRTWIAAIHQVRQDVQKFQFGADVTTKVPPSHSSTVFGFDADPDTVITPIASGWSAWLDHSRVPCINDPRILAAQRRALRALDGDVSTVGKALCQVGLAIMSSFRSYPEHGLATHLGMSSGELDWCHRNRHWLDAALTISLEKPAHFWIKTDHPPTPQPFPGWVPPAAGRYLGYYLVQEYVDAMHSDELTAEKIQSYYRHRLLA